MSADTKQTMATLPTFEDLPRSPTDRDLFRADMSHELDELLAATP